MIFIVLIAPMLWAAETPLAKSVLDSTAEKVDVNSAENPLSNPDVHLNIHWASLQELGGYGDDIIRLPAASGPIGTVTAGTVCTIQADNSGNFKPTRFDLDKTGKNHQPNDYSYDPKSIRYTPGAPQATFSMAQFFHVGKSWLSFMLSARFRIKMVTMFRQNCAIFSNISMRQSW